MRCAALSSWRLPDNQPLTACCACLPRACLVAPPPLPLQEPATAEVAQVFERCKDLGVLLGKGGEC